MLDKFEKIISAFNFDGERIYMEFHGYGHINDTYAVYFKHESAHPTRYILQRINHLIFKNPARMMDNISDVTDHVVQKISALGQNPHRRTLRIVKTADGGNFHLDERGNYWRAYEFIDDATSWQQATPELFLQSGSAFGCFFNMLSDFPAHTLHESIPNFHNTRARFEALRDAVNQNSKGRASQAEAEIAFAFAREADTDVLVDMLAAGELPLRVTHNDTKLNNVMIDNATGEGLCVIDLDTVMPGLALYDFGDSIRFGANTGTEDETDLSKVSLNLSLFEAFAQGYLSQARDNLTDAELKMMPFSAKLMTFECGIRFLSDYLLGDSYFKTSRPNHNLDRCRTQFKLVADMEEKMDAMSEIIKKHS